MPAYRLNPSRRTAPSVGVGLIVFLIVAAVALTVLFGWLVTVVAGWFGFDLALWQGIVIAFLVNALAGSSR